MEKACQHAQDDTIGHGGIQGIAFVDLPFANHHAELLAIVKIKNP